MSAQAARTGKPGAAPGFWDMVRVPRFRGPAPRLLLFTSGYFLQREITSAAARLGWELRELPLPQGGMLESAFVESLLSATASFKPDFALTVNHLGLDRQGELLRLFERMALPLASWFVDSPRLILHDHPGQASPWCAVFTWDSDTVPGISALGFELVAHLPLATDTALFVPGRPGRKAWRADVSFVGDSMVRPVAALAARLKGRPLAVEAALAAAPGFAASPAQDALEYMRGELPALHEAWKALPDTQARLDLEQLLTWEATRLYRLERVRRLAPFSPLVAGDPGWKDLMPGRGLRFSPPLDYYRDLPGFYPSSKVSFNATSLQMKGAANQRVFDVPACGGFLLTDRRRQLEELFDPGTELACYESPDDIEALTRRWLEDPAGRERVARAARERVLARHDYTHRLGAMLRAMRRRYA